MIDVSQHAPMRATGRAAIGTVIPINSSRAAGERSLKIANRFEQLSIAMCLICLADNRINHFG